MNARRRGVRSWGRVWWLVILWPIGTHAQSVYVKRDSARATWQASTARRGSEVSLGPWHYTGPFDSTDGAGFDTVYPPEKGVDLKASYEGKNGRTIAWKAGHRFRDRVVNSLAVFEDNEQIAVYLYRVITAPTPRKLPVLLGSDDTITVWVNGEKLLAHNVGRACRLGDEQLALDLRQGDNELLVKVCQGGGPSGFAFAIDDDADTLLEDIARDFPDEINDLLVELDWLRQARTPKPSKGASMAPEDDAPGACDGVKDGGTGFHTLQESRPWWQVDLGEPKKLTYALLYNREDCPERAKSVMMLVSQDGESWQPLWQNDGTVFHGAIDGRPMQVDLEGRVARFVRLQLPDTGFLHLDEVEVFGEGSGTRNLALHRPAMQSSASPWSTYTPLKSANDEALDRRAFRQATAEALKLARRTLEFVERQRSLSGQAETLERLAAKVAASDEQADWKGLYLETRWLRRRILLSHPQLAFDRLLIVKRPPTLYSHMVDQYEGRHSRPADGLVLLEGWRDRPRPTKLLHGKLPPGAVLHPDLSFDGKRVVFSFCDHRVQNRNDRRFFLYETDLGSGSVRQLTGVPGVDPLEGWEGRESVLIEDFDPCYLPDGGIVFVSTRNQGFGRCHGGRYTPAYVLYRCEADGSDIRRLSYGEANEWDPSVLHNGLVVYTRWDYINRHDTFLQSLWTTRPDGSAVAHYYANSTRNPCMVAEARAVPDSDLVIATAMAHHSYTAGSIIAVDRHKGEEGLDPIRRITPEVSFPETEGWPLGSYSSPWPISEDLHLAAYDPARMIHQGNVAPVAAYGIYLVDALGGRELIYRDPAMSCFSPIPVQPRSTPPALVSTLQPGRKDGSFIIQNVYDSVASLAPGSVKRLRVVRLFDQPTASVPDRSIVSQEITKGVLGTVPVNPDGSVAFRAPARMPLLLQLLDENNMSLFGMRSQVYLQAGETMSCAGCHEPRGTTPTVAQRLAPMEQVDIEPPPGPSYEGGFSFARTVQPVLDRYCIRCHGLERKAADLSLLGTRTSRFNQAYEALVRRQGLVSLAHRNVQTDVSAAGDYGAHAGKLAGFLLKDHRKAAPLDRDSFTRIAQWLDLNCQYYGDYSFERSERRAPSAEGEKALRDHVAQTCGSCHEKMGEQPLAALVNIALPHESRVLKAPLAKSAGGWGQCPKGWADTSQDGYIQMRGKVLQAVGPGATP